MTKKHMYLIIVLCLSGVVWLLPFNWLVFLPVAIVWGATVLILATFIMDPRLLGRWFDD